MPRIRLITDLCSTHEISDICHARQEPIFNTDNGNVDLEGRRIETCEVMANNATVDTAILEAEVEFERDGQLYDARETLAFLRRSILDKYSVKLVESGMETQSLRKPWIQPAFCAVPRNDFSIEVIS